MILGAYSHPRVRQSFESGLRSLRIVATYTADACVVQHGLVLLDPRKTILVFSLSRLLRSQWQFASWRLEIIHRALRCSSIGHVRGPGTLVELAGVEAVYILVAGSLRLHHRRRATVAKHRS